MGKKEIINKLIGDREYLKCDQLYERNIEEIRKILEMPEWKDERYSHLLKPSIFSVSEKNIRPTIELFKKYGIDEYISNKALRRNVTTQRKLLKYMEIHNIPYLTENNDGTYKLNKIINATNTVLKNKYHIDLSKMVDIEVEGPSLDD